MRGSSRWSQDLFPASGEIERAAGGNMAVHAVRSGAGARLRSCALCSCRFRFPANQLERRCCGAVRLDWRSVWPPATGGSKMSSWAVVPCRSRWALSGDFRSENSSNVTVLRRSVFLKSAQKRQPQRGAQRLGRTGRASRPTSSESRVMLLQGGDSCASATANKLALDWPSIEGWHSSLDTYAGLPGRPGRLTRP